MSKGSPWKLYVLLMLFDALLSAFLDNVTTMLLMAPVVCSLSKAVNMDATPFLISLALFGAIGGAETFRKHPVLGLGA